MHIILKFGFCFFLLIFSVNLAAETPEAILAPSKATLTEAAENEITSSQSQEEKSEPEQYYIVEVILFRHLNEEDKLDEYWQHPDVMVDEKALSDLATLTVQPIQTDDMPALAQYDLINKRFLPLRNGIAALPESNYKLADSAAHLRYSKNFNLLAHFGWTQRALEKQSALPILITSDEFSDNLIPSGQLKLSVSRYLHMQVDLSASRCEQGTTSQPEAKETMIAESATLTDKKSDGQLENGESELKNENSMTSAGSVPEINQCVNNTYQFKQQRKMRSKELHYLDNPVYGLLVHVTPYTTDITDETKVTE